MAFPRRSLKLLARRAGFDIVRHPGPATSSGRRLMKLHEYDVDLVVDVGANTGQYAAHLRDAGYGGHLVSIEPVPEAYRSLLLRTERDKSWRAIEGALGRTPGRATVNVAANSVSSSVLHVLQSHLAAEPESNSIGTVEVSVRTLDDVLDEVAQAYRRPFIKVDTQGYELEVLEGAVRHLDRIVGVEVEMSLTPLYDGAPTMATLVDWLEGRGLWLTDIEPEFNDPVSGRLLQVNGLFFRERARAIRENT